MKSVRLTLVRLDIWSSAHSLAARIVRHTLMDFSASSPFSERRARSQSRKKMSA